MQEFGEVERSQVEFVGGHDASLLSQEINPIQQCLFRFGKVVLAVASTLLVESPKQAPRNMTVADGKGGGLEFELCPSFAILSG